MGGSREVRGTRVQAAPPNRRRFSRSRSGVHPCLASGCRGPSRFPSGGHAGCRDRYFVAYQSVLVGSMVASRGTDVGRKASNSFPGQAAKDSSQLAEFYVRYWPAAVKLGYLLTGDKDMAEDLAQEAFVRVAGRFGHLRHVVAFDAYLRRTLVNLHVSGIRRLRLERAYMAKERAGLRAGAPNETDVPEELWQALQELPKRQRAAIVLRYYEDLSEQAVADTLRCSVAAVKSLVARGMATLRLSMEEPQ